MRASVLAVSVFATAALVASASASPLYGIMFRTGGQTSGLNPKLYDVDPMTGAASNPRNVNVNDCVGIAVSPAGTMYGVTDQFGRINNVSGQGGKGLLFSINPVTGQATGIGRIDPTGTSTTMTMLEGDIAFQPSTGVLWGISTHVTYASLFTINTSTGLGTFVANILPPDIVPVDPGSGGQRAFDTSAMAFNAAGDLWVLDTTYPNVPGPARLYRVDPYSGTVLQALTTTTNLGNVAGISFQPGTNELYISDGDTSGTANLYRADLTTGQLTLVGATGASNLPLTPPATTVYTGFSGLAFGAQAVCGQADLGSQGGVPGADGVLDNNDFIVFIDLFFGNRAPADRGIQGGVAGSDGLFDNNDFIVFIDEFFAGC